MSELPKGWSRASVGELAAPVVGSITDGPFGSKLKSSHYTPKGARVIRLTNLGDGNFLDADRSFIDPAHFRSLARHHAQPGDVVVAALGEPIGRASIVPNDIGPALVKADCFRVKPHPEISSAFLVRWINAPQSREKLQEAGHGVGRIRINLGDLRHLELPVPPVAEQQRIVAKLDRLTARTDRAQADLDRIPTLVAHYKQAILAAAFSGELTREWTESKDAGFLWPRRPIGRIVTAVVAGKNLRCDERPPNKNERGVLKVSAVTWGTFDPTAAKTLPTDFQPNERTRVGVGDFLVSRANTLPLVGSVVLVERSPNNLFLSDKVLRLEMPNDFKRWLLWFLRSPNGRAAIESRATGNQLSMRNLSQDALFKIEVPWPDTRERAEIVCRIERAIAWLDRVIDECVRAAHLLPKLHQTILAKAFRGELVPQDSADETASALLVRLRATQLAMPKQMRTRTSKAPARWQSAAVTRSHARPRR